VEILRHFNCLSSLAWVAAIRSDEFNYEGTLGGWLSPFRYERPVKSKGVELSGITDGIYGVADSNRRQK
jgi:hypothetical protein